MLLRPNFEKCEQLAAEQITMHGITDAPVPVFEIIAANNLHLMEYDLGLETSGVLVINNGKGTIGYNPKDAMVRKRFTVAHELGHYLLHRESNELFVDKYFIMKFRGNNSYSEDEYIQEQEANAFAAALLMPQQFIHKILTNDKLNGLGETEIINKLASIFEVSVSAMTFRLTNLNVLNLFA